jgi:hypothetical protein
MILWGETGGMQPQDSRNHFRGNRKTLASPVASFARVASARHTRDSGWQVQTFEARRARTGQTCTAEPERLLSLAGEDFDPPVI